MSWSVIMSDKELTKEVVDRKIKWVHEQMDLKRWSRCSEKTR